MAAVAFLAVLLAARLRGAGASPAAAPAAARVVVAFLAAVFRVVLHNTRRSVRYGIGMAVRGSGASSVVVSAGGRLVPALVAEGSEHVALDIGRKSLASLRHGLQHCIDSARMGR